jgi:hypothetical protein
LVLPSVSLCHDQKIFTMLLLIIDTGGRDTTSQRAALSVEG